MKSSMQHHFFLKTGHFIFGRDKTTSFAQLEGFEDGSLAPGLFTYGSNKNSQLGHEDSDPSPVEGLENVRQADSKGAKGVGRVLDGRCWQPMKIDQFI